MNKRKFITIIVLGISLIVAIVTTFSYAYWTKSVNQTGENEITALGCFEIEYTDTEEISIDKAYPISDEKGKSQEKVYTFTIKNTCDYLLQAQVNLESLEVSGKALPDNYVKAYLRSNDEDVILTKLTDDIKVENIESDVRNTYKLDFGWLKGKSSKTYELKVWVSSDVEYTDDSVNATFKGKIHIAPSPYTGDVAVLLPSSYSDTRFFRNSTYVENIKNIKIENKINIPDDATTWDIGMEEDKVKAFVIPSISGSSYYDLYIQSDLPIKANQDMKYWFSKMTNVDSLKGLELIDFSETTNMNCLFWQLGEESTSFTLDLDESFVTSNVTNMEGMFMYAGKNSTRFNLDVSNLDTSNVTNMKYMFSGTGEKHLNLDLSSFNTSNVTTMEGMFEGTGSSDPNFTLVLGNNFDTSNVTTMKSMFESTGRANPTFTLDVSGFNTSNVTNMARMFYSYAENSTEVEIDVSNWDTSNVTTMETMFNCTAENSEHLSLDVSSWDFSSVTNMTKAFYAVGINSPNFTFTVGSLNTTHAISMDYAFYGLGKLNPTFTFDISTLDTSSATNMAYMFTDVGYSNPNFTLDVSNLNTSKVSNMSYMFQRTGYSNPNFTLDLSNFDTSNVTDMSYMFSDTGYLSNNITIDISNFDTSKVTDMSYMFYGASIKYSSSRNYLKIKFGDNFNTSSVTNMRGMFTNINTLEVENYHPFDTSAVTYFGSSGSTVNGMFQNCLNVNLELDIMVNSLSSSAYGKMFSNAATGVNSEITLNYTSENESLVDAMIATKSENSNVIKGELLTEHTITISESTATTDESSALKYTLIKLESVDEEKTVKSFKLNGNTINGNTFRMPDEDVTITDIEFYNHVVVETDHVSYPNNLNSEVYYEHTFNGATSLTLEFTYQTESVANDYLYIYTSSDTIYGGTSNKYGGSTKRTITLELPTDYIKITFKTSKSGNKYYGFKAVITPNYD